MPNRIRSVVQGGGSRVIELETPPVEDPSSKDGAGPPPPEPVVPVVVPPFTRNGVEMVGRPLDSDPKLPAPASRITLEE